MSSHGSPCSTRPEPSGARAPAAWGRLARWGSPRRFAVGLGAAALVLFLTEGCLFARLPLRYDAWEYDSFAGSIVRGEGHVLRRPDRVLGRQVLYAYRPPGYSAFLAAVYAVAGPRPMAGIVANDLLLAVGVLLCYGLGRRLVGEGNARAGSMVFLAAIATTQVPRDAWSEARLIVLFLGSLWWTLSLRSVARQVLPGLLLGFLHLVRPTTLLWPVGLFVVLILLGDTWRRAGAKALVVLAASLLVVAPWTVRNWRTFGIPVPVSTNGGMNLWIGNNPESYGGHISLWADREPALGGRKALMPPGIEDAGNEAEWDRLLGRRAMEYIFSHPGLFVRRMWDKLSCTCGFGYIRRARAFGPPRQVGLIMAITSTGVALWLAAAAVQGLWACARMLRARSLALGWALVPALVVLFFMAQPLVFFGFRRFVYPAYPFLGLSAAILLGWVVARGRARGSACG